MCGRKIRGLTCFFKPCRIVCSNNINNFVKNDKRVVSLLTEQLDD